MRRTFGQLRASRFGTVVGECQGNIPALLALANECQQILINEASEWGWWGGWARVAFTASRVHPYITLPPQYSRAIGMDVCRFPLRIQNQFYEELDSGIGLRGPNNCTDPCGPREAYDRNEHPTFIDLSPSNQLLRIYPTSPDDVGKNVMFSNALDQNGNGIYSTAASGQVNGFILTLNEPFTTTDFVVSHFDQVTKDPTVGDVVLTQVDATSGTEVTLSRYKPWETNPAYRRYYLGNVPWSCCPPVNPPFVAATVTMQAMCKYEFVPVMTDTDYLIIGNIPAMIEMTMSRNYGSMDSPNSAAQEAKHKGEAMRMLQKELDAHLGKNLPAINFAPFGTARLEYQSIGTMI